jgi:transposase InsO family protein
LKSEYDEGTVHSRKRWGVPLLGLTRYRAVPTQNNKGTAKMSKKSNRQLIDWAHFRFSIIGGLLARPPDKGQLREEIEKLASHRYLHPTQDSWVTFGVSTIERWYYRALRSDDPIKALGRKIRSDAGKATGMSHQLFDALRSQYAKYPHWSYQLHADNLAALVDEQPELGQMPSYSTVLRRMKGQGWYRKASRRRNQTLGQKRAQERREQREVRSFESPYVHALWHLDFHEGRRRVVDNSGLWHTPQALCILDDRSRLCCHIQWYLSETAEALFHGLMQAFHKRGLPRGLMSDNGPAMIAHETGNGLLRLAIMHERTLPYSPYQNGKQEAFWGQLEGRLLAMLSRVEPLTLAFLNRVSQAWIEQEYNRSLHEEIGTSPLERLLQGPDVSRPSPESEVLRFAFTIQERRTQRQSDGTVQIKGVRFEVPSRFRHFKHLYVRYQSWDLGIAYLVDQRTGDLLARIYPQDKTKNAHGYRRTLESSPEPIVPKTETNSDPIPPLLRKILSDYAATGLPPAYLPKEEFALSADHKPKEDNNE